MSYVIHASSGTGTVSERSLKFGRHSTHRIDASSGNGDVTITAAH